MGIKVYPLEVSALVFTNNIYIVVDELTQQAAIIDPAWDMKKIKNTLGEHNINLTSVLITHSHLDHVHLVKPLVKKFPDLKVYISREEASFYRFKSPNLNLLNDGDQVALGNTTIETILTPGHTKGGVCYLIEDNLFTGDTLFISSCGFCSGKGADPSEMFDSLIKLKEKVRPEVKVFPGHAYGKGLGQTFAAVMKKNIYIQISDRDSFIKYRMQKKKKKFF